MRKTLVLVLTVGLVFSVFPALAAAVAPDKLHVQLWPEEKGQSSTTSLLLESAQFPPAMKLPQTIKLPLPKGAVVEWAGEVFQGNDPSRDIQVKHKVNPKTDYDEIVFTLTKSRIAQIEATIPGFQRTGAKRSVSFLWVQAYPSGTVDFAFKTPQGVAKPLMSPAIAYQDKDADGLPFFGTGPMSLSVGQKQPVSISYEIGTGTTSSGNSNLLLGLLIIAVGGGGVALTLYWQVRRRD